MLGLPLVGARSAQAQVLLERFEPAERGSRFFVADSLELDGHLRFAAGVVTSYGSRLRTFRQSPGDQEKSTLIEHALWIHPGASLVIAPGARFAIDLPVALQSGQDVSLDRTFHAAPRSPRLGDARASFDLRLAGNARADVDGGVLAVGVSAYLPTGSGASYAGDDYARVALRIASSLRHGPVVGALRVGYMYRQEGTDPFAGVSLGSEANGVVALGYRFDRLVVGPELYGATILRDAFQRKSTPIEALLGAHLGVGASGSDFQIGLGVGAPLVSGLGAPRFRGVISLEWVPSSTPARDRDQDGVLDADDVCPDVPGLASGPADTRGCPSPPRDSDGDGIIDAEDACPELAGVRSSSDRMAHGCPAPAQDPADAAPPSAEPAPLPP